MRLAQWLLLFSSVVVTGGRADDGAVLEEDEPYDERAFPQHDRLPPTATPRCCSSEDPAHLLIISTMDGKVHALDVENEGALVWQSDLDGAPLMEGNLGKMQQRQPLLSGSELFYLVPSLDGSLYMYSQEQRVLEPIPLSTDMLLQSVRIGKEAVAGGKSVTTTGVDPVTGKIRYHCSSAFCEQSESQQKAYSTLVFRRVSHSVRAVDALNGHEKWNLSVAEYDATLVSRSALGEPEVTHQHVRFLISPPKGSITAIDSCGRTLWTTSLGVHIARGWHLDGRKLLEVSLFESNVHSISQEAHPNALLRPETLFYLGTINEDPFILCSAKFRGEVNRLARASEDYAELVGGRPGSALARTTSFQVAEGTLDDILGRAFRQSPSNLDLKRKRRMIEGPKDEESMRVAMPSPGPSNSGSCVSPTSLLLIGEENIKYAAPYDNDPEGDQGWFVMRPSASPTTGRSSPFNLLSSHDICTADFVKRSLHLEDDVNPLWRLLAIFLMLFTGIIGMFTFSRKRKQRLAAVAAAEEESIAAPLKNVFSISEPASPVDPPAPLQQRETVSDELPPATGSPSDSPAESRRRRHTSTISGNTGCEENFHSKFLGDFEPVKVLGHGGFGVVFEARNKLDECHYAVKRISVENNEKAIERVLREVRAMAKMDHPGIIRFYHTWIERPPPGWQKEKDAEMLQQMRAGRRTIPSQHVTDPSSSGGGNEQPEPSESVDAPALPEEATEDVSWMDESRDAADKAESSSDDSDDEASSSSSDDDEILPLRREPEASVSIVFGNPEKSEKSARSGVSGKSRSKSRSSEISNIDNEVVLATSVDEELLPTRSKASTDYVYVYIQMQLCLKRTLYKWLLENKSREARDPAKVKEWMRQMVSAVQYIHAMGLIHRDIKPQNIFFHSLDALKIGDLGLVTKSAEFEAAAPLDSHGSSASLHTDNVGTRTYMSPEQLANQPYTSKVDVFSLGLIFTELCVPLGTVMERSKVLAGLQQGTQPEHLEERPEEARFIAWLTAPNPDDRPTCEEILACSFLQR